MALKIILQRTYPTFSFIELKEGNTNHIAESLEHKDGIKLVYADSYKRCCYFILASFMVDYIRRIFYLDLHALGCSDL